MSRGKASLGYSFYPMVIGAHSLNFKQFLTTLKNVKGLPSPQRGALARLGHSLISGVCKNLGAQHTLGAKIWSSEKWLWVGTISPSDLHGYWT